MKIDFFPRLESIITRLTGAVPRSDEMVAVPPLIEVPERYHRTTEVRGYRSIVASCE